MCDATSIRSSTCIGAENAHLLRIPSCASGIGQTPVVRDPATHDPYRRICRCNADQRPGDHIRRPMDTEIHPRDTHHRSREEGRDPCSPIIIEYRGGGRERRCGVPRGEGWRDWRIHDERKVVQLERPRAIHHGLHDQIDDNVRCHHGDYHCDPDLPVTDGAGHQERENQPYRRMGRNIREEKHRSIEHGRSALHPFDDSDLGH